MPTDPKPAGSFQSIRLSCDRCRFQKLKCTVPAESEGRGPCERCARARIACVFGRRRQATRQSDSKKRPEHAPTPIPTRPTTPGHQVTPVSPITSMSSVPVSSTISAPPNGISAGLAPDMQLTGPVDSEPEPAGVDPHAWNNLMLGLQNAVDNVVDCENETMHSYEWLQQGFTLGDVYLRDADHSEPTTWSQSPTLTAPSQLTDGTMNMSDHGSLKVSNSMPGQQLLVLISDMQQRLKMLEDGPWQYNSERGLDDYPVGTILHLTHQFSAVAGSVLNTAHATGSSGEISNNASDAPTALFVLGGYMWLVRIYGIVLGHFQRHLSHMPSGYSQPVASSSVASASPTLQLGELPCANASLGLGRIHTAVCMLLDALHGVEEQLGRGGAVARDLVAALLSQETTLATGGMQEVSNGLSSKATAVKGLVREKMGL